MNRYLVIIVGLFACFWAIRLGFAAQRVVICEELYSEA